MSVRIPETETALRYILGVSYRHASIAYLTVIGTTAKQAERRAKRIGTELHHLLPQASLCAPRYKGYTDDGHVVYEMPLFIDQCEAQARATLAKMVLKGQAHSSSTSSRMRS